jgi:hypothetical protein
VGIRQLGYATATDGSVGSGSLGAQIGRLGVGRGPLAVKIELVREQRIALVAIHGRKDLTHCGAIVGAFFSIAPKRLDFPVAFRFVDPTSSPEYVILDWPNRESLA